MAKAGSLAPPVTLQPQYNLLVRDIEHEIVPAALDASIGLLPWSPLGGGWLTGKYKRDAHADRRHPARREPQSRPGILRAAATQQERTWRIIGALEEAAATLGVSMARWRSPGSPTARP